MLDLFFVETIVTLCSSFPFFSLFVRIPLAMIDASLVTFLDNQYSARDLLNVINRAVICSVQTTQIDPTQPVQFPQEGPAYKGELPAVLQYKNTYVVIAGRIDPDSASTKVKLVSKVALKKALYKPFEEQTPQHEEESVGVRESRPYRYRTSNSNRPNYRTRRA